MHVAILRLRKDCIKLLFMLYDESQVSQQRNVIRILSHLRVQNMLLHAYIC